MRKKFRKRSLLTSPRKAKAKYREEKPDPGRITAPLSVNAESPQSVYPTAAESDIDEELPSITIIKEPSHRSRVVKEPAADSESRVDDTIMPRVENRSFTSRKSSRGGILRKGTRLGKKRKSSKSSLVVDGSSIEDTDMHVQLDASIEEHSLSKRKIAYNADSEYEPPRKRRGLVPSADGGLKTTIPCEPSSMQPLSRRVIAPESNDIDVPADGLTTSSADVSPNIDEAREHESSSQQTGDEVKKNLFLKMYNSRSVVDHLLTPLAQRRASRGAAAQAQEKIHSQYNEYPVKWEKTKKESQAPKRAVVGTRKVVQKKDCKERTAKHERELDTSISNARNTKRTKMNEESHVQIEEHIPADTTCPGESPSFRLERQDPRPEFVNTDKVGDAKPRKRGRPPGSKKKDDGDKSKGIGKGKGRGKRRNKEIEPSTIATGSSGSDSIVNGFNSPICASSPTAVASSTSIIEFSSPVPTRVPSTQGNSSTQVSPSADGSIGSSPWRNENDDRDTPRKKIQTDLAMSNCRPPTSSAGVSDFSLSSQDKHLDGGDQQGQTSMDVLQLNHAVPQPGICDYNRKQTPSYCGSQACSQSSQTSRTPWSVPQDETNYSNNSRPPGVNDTHFWSICSQIPKVNFPPLQGDSLCSDTRLYKAQLPNPPPVWAQSRQELCESLSYFRAYQGGVYTHKQRAEGYLLDGYPARYDIWHSDGRYIISHGGGHSALDRLTGRVSLVEDQVADNGSCAALISSWKAAHAIVLVAGSGYRLFPYSLDNMNYVVLGYYHIVHAWEEPEPSSVNSRGYCVRWKFLFRWIEAQGKPWWLKEYDNTLISMNMPLLTTVCKACGERSFRIFGYGWVCTQSGCRAFFQLLDKTNVATEGYDTAFLAPREDPPAVRDLKLNIRPKPPVQPVIRSSTEQPQIATSRHFWKGFWCEKCGKLSCREFWTYWKCSNCNHTLAIKAIIQTPPKINNVKSERFFSQEAGITETTSRLGSQSDPYECCTFTLPFNRGKIHLIKASGQSLQVADRIFRQYQLDASNDESFFRRYSMKTHKLKGRMLSHYFSQNSGEPYEYVGGTNNTVELDRYKSVTKALEYIRSRATLALKYNPDFNEVLSAGYMDEQKMEFHSDGEKDLGPIVASLSLGSPAIMKFRPVPSKWMSDDGQLREGRKTPPVVIELTLRHGDALVMEGAEIQEYYQHAVHPCGFRIAATARRVVIT